MWGLRRALSSAAAVVLEGSASEPVLSAERLLRHALQSHNTLAAAAASPTPITLAEADDKGVRVTLATPADVDAAAVLSRCEAHASAGSSR